MKPKFHGVVSKNKVRFAELPKCEPFNRKFRKFWGGNQMNRKWKKFRKIGVGLARLSLEGSWINSATKSGSGEHNLCAQGKFLGAPMCFQVSDIFFLKLFSQRFLNKYIAIKYWHLWRHMILTLSKSLTSTAYVAYANEKQLLQPYGRIFVCTFGLINICLSPSDDANERKTLNIERA